MILKKILYKKKYIKPFIDNLLNQYSMDNAVFFSEYKGKNFLIILCIKNKIFEVQVLNDELKFFTFHINEDNFIKWNQYKEKIIKMKEQAQASSSKHVILLIAESVRHIGNQAGLSFQKTKDILAFFLIENQDLFVNNTIIITENMGNCWID